MQRFWVIAPIESKDSDLFDRVWSYDLQNDCISIGWEEIGDCSRSSREDILARIKNTFKKKPPQTQSLYANMIWTFYNDIAEGDIVIARRGRKVLSGYGVVSGRPSFGDLSYVSNKPQGLTHQSFLPVKWNAEPKDIVFPTVVFSMLTISELTKSDHDELIAGRIVLVPELEPDPAVEDPNEFVLEKYLEDFIVSNFQGIFKGKLRVYVDTDGITGQQYQTKVGNIDILAFDDHKNEYVVIELKKGYTSDRVVGQTLRYMGWVKDHLCENNQGVRGLIICGKWDEKLSYALKMIDNVTAKYYAVSFSLSDTP